MDNIIELQGLDYKLTVDKSQTDKLIRVLYDLCINNKIECNLNTIKDGEK